ncbi:hypothetical protein BCF55_1560 [Hydrogenivirga caldilitoris]|uniref:YbbR-like protein n=1 Tax=Hydrogenivirga caldilitoris TaxID=246264 RepID=A0A497XSM6_9AQUI|nr:hypothetical protein [Hydrogenivirga caldilitoris]RLJ71261.1 hypothetical protein BCF55_1560 [Hydrogenivirga caldilitoris]
MRLLREIFVKDWKYKLAALLISVSLWSVVNFGSRTAITVSRYVEVRNPKPEFNYKLEPDRVEITVYVVERLLLSKLISHVRAYVDVSKIDKPGVYKLNVISETAVPVLIHPASVEPPVIKVRVLKKPPE